jgi:DNA-directed RNA polymerase alpha subunit
LDLSTPIEGLELSTRSKNALVNQGVKTVAQLVPHTEQELLKLPNLGGISLAEIKALLKRHGLRLGRRCCMDWRMGRDTPNPV